MPYDDPYRPSDPNAPLPGPVGVPRYGDPQRSPCPAAAVAAPPIGLTQSLTIKSLMVGIGIVAVVGLFGVRLVVTDADYRAVSEGVLAAAALVAQVAAWVGRVRARQPVALGATGPKLTSAAAMAFLLLTVTGCAGMAGGGTGSLRVAAVEGAFRRVAIRHDNYVNVDPSLTPLERRIDLRDTELLRAAIEAAKGQPTTRP